MATAITVTEIRKRLRSIADEAVAERSKRFFKTDKGAYGEDDRFHGIRVPVLRSLLKEYRGAATRTVVSLLTSDWHEERLLAVLLLVEQYKRGSPADKEGVFETYLAHRQCVNNWDLVDSSAHFIIGPHLQDGSRRLLYDLAVAESLWDRRIAMISTYHFIRQHDFDDALKIAKILLDDEQDLIHKSVGWMLREIGNRDRPSEESYLRRHYKKMPRTMLRYAIEKFPETLRKRYLNGTV